jgi:hypothetical protein
MSKPVTVIFETKSYTWDGERWYGTEDHMMPPGGMIHKLQALIPPQPAKKVRPPAAPRA